MFACIGVLATPSYGCQKPVCALTTKGQCGHLWGSITGMSRSGEKTQLELDSQLQIKQNLIPTLASDFLSDYWVLCALLCSHKGEPCKSDLRLRLVGGFLTVLTQGSIKS